MAAVVPVAVVEAVQVEDASLGIGNARNATMASGTSGHERFVESAEPSEMRMLFPLLLLEVVTEVLSLKGK